MYILSLFIPIVLVVAIWKYHKNLVKHSFFLARFNHLNDQISASEDLTELKMIGHEVDALASVFWPRNASYFDEFICAYTQCQSALDEKIQTLENHLAEKQEMDDIKARYKLLEKVLEMGQYKKALSLARSTWRRYPQDIETLSTYINLSLKAPEMAEPEEAAQALIDAELDLREFQSEMSMEQYDKISELEDRLGQVQGSMAKMVRKQRQRDFEAVMNQLKALAEQVPTVTSFTDLYELQDRMEHLKGSWGPMNSDEIEIWQSEWSYIAGLIAEKEGQLREESKAAQVAAAKEEATSTLLKIKQLREQILETDDVDALEHLHRQATQLPQPDFTLLPIDLQEKLGTEVTELQRSFELVQSKIAAKITTEYNVKAVHAMDELLERLKTEGKRLVPDIKALAGDFASINTTFLEPALLQYYQVCVAKVLEVLDDSNSQEFMQLIASTEKDRLEEKSCPSFI